MADDPRDAEETRNELGGNRSDTGTGGDDLMRDDRGDDDADEHVELHGDQDGGGLDVAGDDVYGVGALQGPGRGQADLHYALRRQRLLPGDELGQAFSRDVLHGVEEEAARPADVVDAHDVRMLERCRGSGLTQESLLEAGPFAEPWSQDLQGDGSLHGELPRPVDGTHASLGQL